MLGAQPRHHPLAQRLAEELAARAAELLGLVHRGVGVAHERRAVDARAVGEGEADRRAHVQLVGAEGDRLLKRLAEPVAERDGVVVGVEVGAQHGELVAAEARDQVVLPDPSLQSPRDRLQQLVAERVPEGVVDELEAVEVEEEHRGQPVGAALRERGVEAGDEQAPIGEPGERVMQRAVAQAAGEIAHQQPRGAERAHRQQPARDLLVPDVALDVEHRGVGHAHEAHLQQRLAQREEAEHVEGRPQVVEDVGGPVFVGREHGPGDHERAHRDRDLQKPHRHALEADEQEEAHRVGCQGGREHAGLVGLGVVRQGEPQHRERGAGEVEIGEGASDQRPVLGGILRGSPGTLAYAEAGTDPGGDPPRTRFRPLAASRAIPDVSSVTKSGLKGGASTSTQPQWGCYSVNSRAISSKHAM